MPGFDLAAAREEHVARNRATELARSQAAYLAWVAAGRPKRARPKAEKKPKKAKMVDREEEESDTWDSDDEEEDNRHDVAHKNRRQEDEDEASYQGDGVDLERRAKSARGAKPSSLLKAFVCDDSDSSLHSPLSSPPPSPPPVPKRAVQGVAKAKASGRGKKRAATAATRSVATAVPARAPAAAAVGAARDPAAAPPAAKGRAVTRAAGRKAVPAAVPAPVAARPVTVPMRKRRVELKADREMAAAVQVVDVEEMEQALLLPDSDMINSVLVPHLAHVTNTVVDDYVRLLKRAKWPAGMLVETTAHWVQFGLEKRPDVVAGIFGEQGRLVGINHVLWPIYSSNMGHFALLVIDVEQQSIRMLDSIPDCRKKWDLSWLQALLKRTFGWKADASVNFEKCRLQGNSHDCGVYVMGNLRSFVESAHFNDRRMPGQHLGERKAEAVLALRKHFAEELRASELRDWS